MLEFIAANLPILICFVIGIGLLILEAFMPGFGAPGIIGIILLVFLVQPSAPANQYGDGPDGPEA